MTYLQRTHTRCLNPMLTNDGARHPHPLIRSWEPSLKGEISLQFDGNVAAMDESLYHWFAQEILVHEEALVRFLARSWPNRDDVYDMRQDTYVRVYEAAARSRPASPKAFLYATARNLMADRLRRGRVVSIDLVGDLESLSVIMEEPEPDNRTGTWQELERLAKALDRLPARCREVVWLHKMEDLTYAEVAARLGISVKTVEKQVSKGIKRLTQYYLGLPPVEAQTAQEIERPAHEHPHG